MYFVVIGKIGICSELVDLDCGHDLKPRALEAGR